MLLMPLTPEQTRVVQALETARILVTASAGTGKTYALIARLGFLVERCALNPGGDILVLSFSRSAVREIRDRAAVAEGDVRYVRAVTFDSFATRLLYEYDPASTWMDKGYDDRIVRAASLIRGNDDARAHVASYRHVLVDEIQDLVGERADLVKLILETAEGGFTLLGDPAQGIFNFQLQDPEARRIGSRALYDWLRHRFGTDLIEVAFVGNHRAQSPQARIALEVGERLAGPRPDYPELTRELEAVIYDLRTLGTLEQAAPILGSTRLRTAVLCRTNGQALLISRTLFGLGVNHAFRHRATDRILPAWIAVVLGGLEQLVIGRSTFEERVAALLGDALDPALAWRMLKRLDRGPRDTLNIALVAQRIRAGNVPDELNFYAQSNLVVSTIHRAKGLEFDQVVLVSGGNGPTPDGDAELEEEARVLYVALSRPRRKLFQMRAPDTYGLSLHRMTNRWVRKPGRWQWTDVEVMGDDVHDADPAGGFACPDCNPRETQEYIRSSVKPGDPVRLTRPGLPIDASLAYYRIEHAGRVVGTTNERFGGILFSILKLNANWKVTWPAAIEDLRVDAVDTVAGTEAAARRSTLGAAPLWLRVRVSGLGSLHFEP